jgi:hypothetical protein
MFYCNNLLVRLPSAVEKWYQLEVLKPDHCTSLVALPIEVSGWVNLRVISLVHCSSLRTLSEGVNGWYNVESINLTSEESIPNSRDPNGPNRGAAVQSRRARVNQVTPGGRSA